MMRGPRYSKEEFSRRGKEIYEGRVRALVEPTHKGKIISIDIETGDFEIGDDVLETSERLFSKRPDAQPWSIRIGSQALHKFGGKLIMKSS